MGVKTTQVTGLLSLVLTTASLLPPMRAVAEPPQDIYIPNTNPFSNVPLPDQQKSVQELQQDAEKARLLLDIQNSATTIQRLQEQQLKQQQYYECTTLFAQDQKQYEQALQEYNRKAQIARPAIAGVGGAATGEVARATNNNWWGSLATVLTNVAISTVGETVVIGTPPQSTPYTCEQFRQR